MEETEFYKDRPHQKTGKSLSLFETRRKLIEESPVFLVQSLVSNFLGTVISDTHVSGGVS